MSSAPVKTFDAVQMVRAVRDEISSTIKSASERSGWRSVFGLADPKAVRRIDTVLAAELEQVDSSGWC